MKKLKNEQGVTILMALLLVLTAAVVSAVILSAALSAARAEASARGGPPLWTCSADFDPQIRCSRSSRRNSSRRIDFFCRVFFSSVLLA